MINLWLPTLNGEIRLHHQGNWISYANFEVLAESLVELGLLSSQALGTASSAKSSKTKNIQAAVYLPTLQTIQITQLISRSQYHKLGSTGLAYLLENHTLTPIERLQVKSAMINNDRAVICAVDQNVIEQVGHGFSLIGVEIKALLPDFLLMPKPAQIDEAYVYADRQTTVMRYAEYFGVAEDEFELLIDRLPQITHIHALGESAHQVQAGLINSSVVVTEIDDQPAPLSNPQAHDFNLLPKNTGLSISLYWRIIAAVFVLAVASMLIYDGLRIWRYSDIETNYQSQMYQQYTQWFNQAPPEDLKRQVDNVISHSAQRQTSVLGMLSAAAPLLRQSDMVATRINYQNDTLAIYLTGNDISGLEALVTRMQEQGLSASLGNVTPVSGKVEGIIRIMP